MLVQDGQVKQHPKRHYLGLGEWLAADARVDDQFARDEYWSEPHFARKRAILKRYPQVEQLYGTAIETVYIACLVAGCQILVAYLMSFPQVSTIWMILTSMVIGGTLSALVGVIEHETCHNLAHPNPLVNRLTGFIANMPMVVPVAASFKKFHLEHHTWQGVEGMDPDLPLAWEIYLIRGNYLMKALWIAIYPAMYGIRGFAMAKRGLTNWERANLIFMIVVDLVLMRIVGWKGMAYLTMSVWFGYSYHPAAAHFIQEHYTFWDKQETYSYYGPMNAVTMNIGLHNEHHDFVRVPWTRIWALYYLAKEYYEPLKSFDSWLTVHYRFLTDPTLGPVSRVVRNEKVHRQDRKLEQFK